MEDCTLCEIVSGKLPAFRIYEDNYAVAFLDIYPNVKGQALVVPKKHVGSYIFDLDDSEIHAILISAKQAVKILEKGLGTNWVNIAFEGLDVNHLHAKLYPCIGMQRFKHMVAQQMVYFDTYPGYMTTLMGPRAKDEELKKLQDQILGK